MPMFTTKQWAMIVLVAIPLIHGLLKKYWTFISKAGFLF
jgi:hypothetical protein